ncbi:PREDICTED: disease resistance protein RPM1-like isoform X2 [Nelumbo nucifera]|uniref:Disease resistance protein RPM1-like isoform X2 n=1 Tax=Nelumbo nucifera TaxID=4432 RepID=A0A1U8Q8D1_NELNU|nr:PREDICTED: disease resistance protein RPM1-like isoform X2 [Nelumbo nucifera]
MAESAVGFLLEHLTSLIEEKVKLLKDVDKDVKSITDELKSIQAFLRDADTQSETNDTVKDWVAQVRNVAYDIEDVLDEFMLRFAQRGQQQRQHCLHRFISYLQKTICFLETFKIRHSLATQIKEIKDRVHDISTRRDRYKLRSLEQASAGSNSTGVKWHDIREDALLLDEAELVGIGKPKEEIIGWIVEDESRLGVISVVGMGGLGKTTLVKKVYDDQRVKRHFQTQAWVTFSESPEIHELLIEMIKQLVYAEQKQPIPQDVAEMKDVQLKQRLQEFLKKKRYVVVLDDIWTIPAWDSVKNVFPNNNFGSRIIISTRSNDVASSCIKSYFRVYNLKPLSQEESWTLFCKKTFSFSPEQICPPELEVPSQSIVKKCGGLPLAIVTVGGVLSTKQKTTTEWEMFNHSLGTDLFDDDRLKGMMKILTLSYNDLPYHLKFCFLSLFMFPEDELIEKMRLIRIWMAEGFIRRKEGKTLEEVGESYFHELINRSLLQIAKTDDDDGRVEACRVHDLIREIILSKARDQNFGAIIKQDVMLENEKIRRLSFHHFCEMVPQQEKSTTHLRSLFTFNVNTLSNTFTGGEIFSKLKLLKVLDLRDAPLSEFLEEFTNLFHLRYLSLRNTDIKEIPDSIKKLQNLETLDLKQTYVTELPTGILNLDKLRHLLVYRKELDFSSHLPQYSGFKAPSGIGGLVSLQKLDYIEANTGSELIRGLERLVQLRRLGIVKLRREDGIHLCSSINKMRHLESLGVHVIEEEEILDLESLSTPPPLLRRIMLKGRLEKLPRWIPSLHNLFCICLWGTKLKDDPLEALEGLSNLMTLYLIEAYRGEQLHFQSEF